jgi:nitroreductase
VLISDTSRFGAGTPELKYEWGAIDTGIVSQNIALFCAAKGLGTRPRASISKDNLRKLLKLKDTQQPFLEHPVGYLATAK